VIFSGCGMVRDKSVYKHSPGVSRGKRIANRIAVQTIIFTPLLRLTKCNCKGLQNAIAKAYKMLLQRLKKRNCKGLQNAIVTP